MVGASGRTRSGRGWVVRGLLRRSMGAIVLEQFSQEQTRAQVDLIECMLMEPGSRILDVPCGSGRISLELTARGY